MIATDSRTFVPVELPARPPRHMWLAASEPDGSILLSSHNPSAVLRARGGKVDVILAGKDYAKQMESRGGPVQSREPLSRGAPTRSH